MDRKAFYTRALDYLDALDIETDEADDCHKGWKQLKFMFKGDDRYALKSLLDNSTIMEESMKMPQHTLDAIGTTIKSEEHFWTFWDKLLSDVRHLPGEGIHVLSMPICKLISQWKFHQADTQEILKIMVLQHAVCYHEARDWICQQDQSQLTYQSLLTQCKLLESKCKQYQKAKEKGWADIASITAVISSASSIHAYALTTFPHCNKCGYSHPVNKCPAKGQTCYACGGYNGYTALYKKKQRKLQQSSKTQRRGYQSPKGHTADTVDALQAVPPAGSHAAADPAIASLTVPPATLPIVQPPSSTPRTASM